MLKQKKIFIAVLLLTMLIPIKITASTKYTIDDLRELMGMDRLSEEGPILEIERLLSSCYQQNEWNELVSALGNIDNAQLDEFKRKEDSWYKAKDVLESNFISNMPIETILTDYADYKTADSLRIEYIDVKSFDLDLIDTSDINAKIAYANSVLDAADDNTNIGVIGYEMKTFTKSNLLISIPFGDSISITSGNKQTNDGLTVNIKQNHKIYSQFNGVVSAITDNSIIIKTGKSIEIEYIGISPSVKKEQKVKQYDLVGKSNTKTMTVKFRLNTICIDPLLLYGTRSSNWYGKWISSNPGCTLIKNDYSKLQDKLETIIKETPDLINAGIITNEDGTTTKIKVQGENYYTDAPDNIVIEKIGPSIIVNRN